jgi:hypothetical protein
LRFYRGAINDFPHAEREGYKETPPLRAVSEVAELLRHPVRYILSYDDDLLMNHPE